MSQDFDKKVLVIGADAIGQGIAVRFAREGAQVAVIDPDTDSLQEVASRIQAVKGQAHTLNAAIDQHIGEAVNAAIKQLGGVDVLVTNVLPQPAVAPLEGHTSADFGHAFGRVQAAAIAMQQALPALQQAGCGRIINVGHRYGEAVNESIAAYNSAAWALVGLTRTAAMDWGRYQIATNLLLPLADTPELRQCHAQRARVIDLMIGQLPMKRLGDPVEDIGAAAMYLACDTSAFVNGEIIHADGGQHVAGPVLNPARFA